MPSLESVKFTEENGNVSQVLTPNNGDASTSTFVDSTPIQDESFSKNLPICESDASFPSVTLKQERLHCIYREYDAVVKNFIEGVYVTPGAESPLVWFGLLVVRTGIFYGGLFRFTITIPEEFPDTNEIPIVQFEESLFHPLINPKNNCVDLNRFFPSGWQRDRNHIYQVITATQGIFFRCQCEPSQAANPEASILLKENRSKFVQLAHNAVRRSRTQIYALPSSDDQNAIRFTPWDDVEMEPYRQYLLGKSELPENKKFSWRKHPIKNGLSWVKNEKQQQNNSLFYLCDHFY
uniref:UBC core domain-containing protein n=1 Tax=Meloidogyne enterolobii TaxID=390850 RepID=A0A6V7YDE2_MELEN|nr:unnamed protein product [Meloidogyne enterolobii]